MTRLSLRYALKTPWMSGARAPGDSIVSNHVLGMHREMIFEPRGNDGAYECMECAWANNGWIGYERTIADHVRTHEEMARWFYHMLVDAGILRS